MLWSETCDKYKNHGPKNWKVKKLKVHRPTTTTLKNRMQFNRITMDFRQFVLEFYCYITILLIFSAFQLWTTFSCVKKVKIAHTRLPSVGFRSWSRFLAVSLQVMWVINPAVGCHYFPPGLQLLPQPLRGLLPILLFGEQRHNGCEQFA